MEAGLLAPRRAGWFSQALVDRGGVSELGVGEREQRVDRGGVDLQRVGDLYRCGAAGA